jgi:L-iditol 2-dehydrogenase
MKYLACDFVGNRQLELKHKELPPLKDNEVLIRIEAATICGTDLHILEGNYESQPPLVLGHEFAGYVAGMGSAVNTVTEGDLVTVEPHIYCGLCKYCRVGKEHMCSDRIAFGVHADGGFAEYCIVTDKNVYQVPEGISPSVAAVTENIGCCLHGIERAGVKQGDYVAVLGGGFVGIVMAEFARMNGAGQITIVEPNEYRRSVAAKRGFQTINPLEEDVVQKVRVSSYGLGVDVAIESAGRLETAKMAVQMVDRCGTVLFFGVVPPRLKMEIEPNEIYAKELNLIGSVRNPYNHYRSIEKLKGLNLEELVTHHFKLEDIEEAFQAAKQGAGFKVAIHPSMMKENPRLVPFGGKR